MRLDMLGLASSLSQSQRLGRWESPSLTPTVQNKGEEGSRSSHSHSEHGEGIQQKTKTEQKTKTKGSTQMEGGGSCGGWIWS